MSKEYADFERRVLDEWAFEKQQPYFEGGSLSLSQLFNLSFDSNDAIYSFGLNPEELKFVLALKEEQAKCPVNVIWELPFD